MTSTQKIKAVIFDLDGTIADTLPLCIAAFRQSIEPLIGKTISDDEIVANFGPSEEGTIRKLIPAHEQEGIAAYLKHYEALHQMCPVAFTGVKDLLDMLRSKGVLLAMVTGKGVHSTRISLKQFGLSAYFEVLEAGSPEGPVKVRGIQSVLQQLGTSKEESLYVGDAPSDIKYCKEIGIPIAAAAWASTADERELKRLEPEYLFTSITDFERWIMDQV